MVIAVYHNVSVGGPSLPNEFQKTVALSLDV